MMQSDLICAQSKVIAADMITIMKQVVQDSKTKAVITLKKASDRVDGKIQMLDRFLEEAKRARMQEDGG